MSDKFKVIDHASFEQMQQSCSASTSHATPKIRNAKYKRMAASSGFDLFQFVKINKGTQKRKHKIRKSTNDDLFKSNIKKKKGKQREGGRKEKHTRLKKSILQYRLTKRAKEKQLAEATAQLQEISLISDNENHQLANPELEPEINHNPSFGQNEGLLDNVDKKTNTIHSRSFREYCDNLSTPQLKQHTEYLLRELNRFQRRAYAQNEIKARAHRRLVVGFREVTNFLRINKVKLVIVATDCERCEGTVGLDQTISNMKSLCADQNVPIAFIYKRRQLAYFLYKKASISCVGILDYDGLRDTFSQLFEALTEAKEAYKRLTGDSIKCKE